MKTLTKGLFLSAIALTSLVGCGGQNKTEWNEADKALFEEHVLFEMPFFHNSEVSYDEDGKYLLIKSTDKPSKEDLDGFAKTLKNDKYKEFPVPTSDGFSLDVDELDFEPEGQVYKLDIEDKDVKKNRQYSLYLDMLTYGLDKDGFFNAAISVVYAPFLNYGYGDLHGGPRYYEDEGEVLDSMMETAGMIISDGFLASSHAPSTAMFETKETFPVPALTETAEAYFLNYAILYPYTLGNANGDYDPIYEVDFNEGEGSDYTQSDFDELVATLDQFGEVEESKLQEGGYDLTVVNNGYTVVVTYAFDEDYASIVTLFQLADFQLPAEEPNLINVFLENLGLTSYDPEYPEYPSDYEVKEGEDGLFFAEYTFDKEDYAATDLEKLKADLAEIAKEAGVKENLTFENNTAEFYYSVDLDSIKVTIKLEVKDDAITVRIEAKNYPAQ